MGDSEIDVLVLWAPVTHPKKPSLLDYEQNVRELEKKGYITMAKDGKEFKIPQRYFEERAEIDSNSLLKNITSPALVFHAEGDETLPLEHSRKAVELLPEGSELIVVESDRHSMWDMMDEEVVPQTVEWFKNRLFN